MTLFNIEITGCNVKPKRYRCIFIKSPLFLFFFYNFFWLQSIYDAITALRVFRIFVKAIKAYAWRNTYPDRNMKQKSLITRVITKTKQHEQHILILYVSLFIICVKTFCFYKKKLHPLFILNKMSQKTIYPTLTLTTIDAEIIKTWTMQNTVTLKIDCIPVAKEPREIEHFHTKLY